ncbi:7-cyano-7-deazaguanine synthase [Hydrogenobacter hydrogenophilus]|uniref:7-cyano-7-deazaguanine synthase n=1 Tax=Hydrogenobacter hydrogenophilus TaxID=35835 RepID=A0A285NWJ0_9AQUI|nr:7-cyano-7-deazaguanine synthase [Hydrogenobacter hydrogenophilus]SNZ13293.1 7-cyano-7-deazaguanine synthase [Hydrogenobacter hydrogenophilus]
MSVRIAVLFSGGVESTTLLYMYLQKGYLVYPVYVKTGEKWESLELENAINLWRYTKRNYPNLMALRVLKVQGLASPRKTLKTIQDIFIPLRNMTLITTCALYAFSKDINRLAIGSLGLYAFPDNTAEYLKELEKLIAKGLGKEFFIETPLFGLEKAQVVKMGLSVVPYHLTLSCANPRKIKGKIVPCGKCIKCKERQEALAVG